MKPSKPAVPRDWERTIWLGAIGLVLLVAIGLGVWIVNAQQPSDLKAGTTPEPAATSSN